MNTIATAAKRPSASVAALRLVIAAGSWGNALLILGYALALLPWLHRGTGDSGHLAVTLSAITIMFWAMLAGARLIASIAQAAQLRLPGVSRLLTGHVGVLLVLAVLMPALLLAVAGSEALPFNLAVLGIGLLAGLLFAAMPPWLMFVLMALGYLPYALKQLWSPTSPLAIELPQALALALALLLAGNLWCGWRIARRRGFGNGWSTPLALAFGNGQSLLLANAEQVQAGAAMFSQGTPIGSNLHRQPQQALAIALGPGFGRSTARSVPGTQLPVLGVALLWLLIAQHGDSGLPVALLFAPLLALSPALAPLMRVVTVFRLPAMGLHELALLPGLPPLPAQALIVQLTRQMLLRSLPALLIMAITCTLLDAGRAFYPLLFWSYCGSLIWLHGLGLLALQQRRFRTGLWLAMVVLAVAAYASMLPSRGATVPAGLLPTWQVACLLGALVSGAAQQRLRQLPHPWLRH